MSLDFKNFLATIYNHEGVSNLQFAKDNGDFKILSLYLRRHQHLDG